MIMKITTFKINNYPDISNLKLNEKAWFPSTQS